MTTDRQRLGEFGERLVCKRSNCPRCKRPATLRRLPTNFKCADVICDFCGYLAQVKTTHSKVLDEVPNTVLGAAWSVQQERMNSGIFFPLFLVLVVGLSAAEWLARVHFRSSREEACVRAPVLTGFLTSCWNGSPNRIRFRVTACSALVVSFAEVGKVMLRGVP